METKAVNNKPSKPFIIANPIYDTVFKRLMENQRIAKFFLSTILEQQIEDLTVLPQEFTYKLLSSKVSDKNSEKVEEKEKNEKKEDPQYYFIFRLDFMATVITGEDTRRKILIELQKSWSTQDVMRFRKYLGEQYIREEAIEGKDTMLPITTIYILGNNLPEIDCPCIKVGRTHINMLNKRAISATSEFIELLTHDSYIIQTGRITDVRYTTNLDKLLSIFEQRYFVTEKSETRKEYRYQPDDENMEIITDLLYEMGADPKKRKELEDEEEALRTVKALEEPLKKTIEKQTKQLAEKDKELEELKEKDAKRDKELEELKEKNAKRDKELEELKEKYAEIERLLRDKLTE